jgi:hypothetical protein
VPGTIRFQRALDILTTDGSPRYLAATLSRHERQMLVTAQLIRGNQAYNVSTRPLDLWLDPNLIAAFYYSYVAATGT